LATAQVWASVSPEEFRVQDELFDQELVDPVRISIAVGLKNHPV